MAAMLMFAIAAVLPAFIVPAQVKWFISIALIASSYTFCVSLPLAAVVGHRGLSMQGPPVAKLVFIGNILGAWLSLAAVVGIIYAGYVSL
jgi:hypothetical protein